MIIWLSFADGSLPKGHQFLGACIVEVKQFDDPRDTLKAAIRKAHVLGINPGGEVQSMELPGGEDFPIHPSWFDVLLDAPTIKAHDTAEGWANPRPS